MVPERKRDSETKCMCVCVCTTYIELEMADGKVVRSAQSEGEVVEIEQNGYQSKRKNE